MDRRNLLLIQELNTEALQQKLREGFEAGKLETVLRSHWAQYVPAVFSARLDAEASKEDRKAKRVLLRPIETFLCGGDCDEIFKKLKESDHPPQLCGKVFKMGEPTYSCRDCGMDPTCVLCIECFQKSAHKKHRYKMSTSGGGGYCDCGDREAWKTEPFCDIHKKGLDQTGNKDENPTDNLPPDLRERARQIYLCCVKYTTEMMLWEDCQAPPEDLKPSEMDQYFVTMLFNDEVHTYDQVITTLMRSTNCEHTKAVEFATAVDREGRSPVLYGEHDKCMRAKGVIERQTSRPNNQQQSLKVQVMHTSVVSHQMLAQRILGWLQQIITQSDGLRQLFCELTMSINERDPTHSWVESMMLADTKLWKSARVQCHQLFMAGILMDAESKKNFAVLFSKMYPDLMRNFIDDDHDHSVCAVAESVQIFTVPTLARMLITDHNLLEVVLDTFLQKCESKKNDYGKFAFDRHDGAHKFRRAQYMLYDLKYALTAKPQLNDWNCSLRVNFLRGFSKLLTLLNCMQGMDAVKRQVGQHIEYEPEWEGAFNLQLKLADNIAMMIDWAGTDHATLIEAFTKTTEILITERVLPVNTVLHKVCGYTAACIKYDVGAQPVSIHLPVSRILAGLYPKLNKFNVNLQQLHSQLNMAELLEMALRCQVLISQSQAGMWRRNGYSLLNQIYFYHNVKCRTEMYDKDIIMLQAAAALMDSNIFLIHLINKFGLINWIKVDYDDGGQDDSLKNTVTLAEEFFNLLIVIISERYVEGVGDVSVEDMVRHELIHQLCIHNMAHSELTKALPEDPYRETGIDEVVHKVADFKKPTGLTGKGMYELKPECYAEYNPFFYHYSRQEQSKAEEAQRKRKKIAGEDQALPPPIPPPFNAGFASVVNILHSDVMILVMRTVLTRMTVRWSRSWSDTQFEKVLHLIGLAVHEDIRSHHHGDNSFKFVHKAVNEPEGSGHSILTLLEGFVGHARVTHEAQKDLLSWVIKNLSEVKQLRNSVCNMETTTGTYKPLSKQDEKLTKEKKRKADLAAKRRAKIMAQMSQMQRNFIKDNAELFESTPTELPAATSEMDISQVGESSGVYFPVAIGPHRSPSNVTGNMRHTCILCQEEQDVSHNERAMVLAAFVQKSMVMSKNRDKFVEDPEKFDPVIMPADLILGAHTSTCGHVMHSDCWQRFYDAVMSRERRRTLRFRHHLSYEVEKGEYLCPLCETLSNTVIPLIPHLSTLLKDNEKQEVELCLNDWLDGIQKTVCNSIQQAQDKESEEDAFLFVPCPLSSITKVMAESVAKNFQMLFDYVYDDASAHFSDTITEMLRKFSTDAYAIGLGVHPDEENIRVAVMGWSTCAYSIMTVEECLQDEGKPLIGALPSRTMDCVAALVKFASVCSQVVQPDVVKKHCVTLLSALVYESPEKRLQEMPCVLEMNMFHYLVNLCLSLPTLYAEDDPTSTKLTRIPTGGLNDSHIMSLALTAHLTQILLTANLEQHDAMETEIDAEGEVLVKIYQHVRQMAGVSWEPLPASWQLMLHVREACLPFLRCSTLFFHYVTGVTPPEELVEPGCNEFDLTCRYLSLPTQLSSLFSQGEILNTLVKNWCEDEAVKRLLMKASKDSIVHYPLCPNQLIKLPADYSELINKVSTFTCPKSDGDDSRAPTLCLVCGKVLCSQSYCCQTQMDGQTVGAATAHAQRCGAGVGVFLRVRECQILLLSSKSKGFFFPPPYLDAYGETDQGLRRGNPLHLCEERYKKLQKLWLSHGVPEEVAHSLESNTSLISIEWQHL